MNIEVDEEFLKLENKVIDKVVRKDSALIMIMKDGTQIGIYNKAEVIKGNIELGIKIY